MSCKKEGFITMQQNDLRDLTANLLTDVFKDVDIEPQLLPVTKALHQSTSSILPK